MRTLLFIVAFFIGQLIPCLAQNWQPVGTGAYALKASGSIECIVADTGNILYATSSFSDTTTGIGKHYFVAKWNGIKWDSIGYGTNSLNANAYIKALCLDSNHNLYAAGSFTNNLGKCYVAKWDGTKWSELGIGVSSLNPNKDIYTLCCDKDNNIYAAGNFTSGTSDTEGNKCVAKWDGSAWNILGKGVSEPDLGPTDLIFSITTDILGNIYAAGSVRYKGKPYYPVIKWDGITWSRLGGDTAILKANAPIWSLVTDKTGNVYAAGMFSNAAGVPYVVKWNGISWNEIGTGSNHIPTNKYENIFSIQVDSEKNIYTAVSSANGYMLKWNGKIWEELGIGKNSLNANSFIFSTCLDKNKNIYAAGSFTDSLTDDKGHCYVAKYSSSYSAIPKAEDILASACIYPQPAYDFINIECGSYTYSNAIYSIYDNAGRVTNLHGSLISSKMTIDIRSLHAGTYIIYIATNKHQQTIKFIKV